MPETPWKTSKMKSMDDATRALAGKTIWNVAEWLEAHFAGEPYEMFSDADDAEKFGYRLTVERIPYQAPVALAAPPRIPVGALPFGTCGCGSTSCAVLTADHKCWCLRCNPGAWWMVTCGQCGSKRCPKAISHTTPCMGKPDPAAS